MLFPYTFEKLFLQIFAMNIYFGYRIIKAFVCLFQLNKNVKGHQIVCDSIIVNEICKKFLLISFYENVSAGLLFY